MTASPNEREGGETLGLLKRPAATCPDREGHDTEFPIGKSLKAADLRTSPVVCAGPDPRLPSGRGIYSVLVDRLTYERDRNAIGPTAQNSLRSKLAGNPAEDCTKWFKGMALRHGQHDGESDVQEVGYFTQERGDGRVSSS